MQVLLVHSLRARHSADEAAIEDIRLFGMWANQKPIANDAYSAIDIIVSDLRMKGKVLGYEGDFISLSQYQKLQDITQATKMVDVSDFLKRSRNIKDEYEINLLRLSSYLTNVGMEAALPILRKSEARRALPPRSLCGRPGQRSSASLKSAVSAIPREASSLPCGAIPTPATGCPMAASAQAIVSSGG